MKPNLNHFFVGILMLTLLLACQTENNRMGNSIDQAYYPSTNPSTRWWWFATEIKKHDIKHQLDDIKQQNEDMKVPELESAIANQKAIAEA